MGGWTARQAESAWPEDRRRVIWWLGPKPVGIICEVTREGETGSCGILRWLRVRVCLMVLTVGEGVGVIMPRPMGAGDAKERSPFEISYLRTNSSFSGEGLDRVEAKETERIELAALGGGVRLDSSSASWPHR